ncbi:M23 family metallopeptidase [Streptomyces paromomycinus]|uniref:Peptidase n=1 Tax=Streptomyces paromomycinus TaxID=92743 RepID=A0A401W5W6_STREY|nr:M23 family metallopeptidase [Streptomyces paromomycinus]GCD44737.1 peptidase [Streptomyces paromomycinus]
MASNSPAGSGSEVPFGAPSGASGPFQAFGAGTGGAAVSAAAADAAVAAGAPTTAPTAASTPAATVPAAGSGPFAAEPAAFDTGTWEEWNPTEDSVRPVRGKHRVAGKQRGGLARGGTVLGVGVIAAVGAGGMATAEEKPQLAISLPDVGGLADELADDLAAVLPAAESLPGIGDLVPDSEAASSHVGSAGAGQETGGAGVDASAGVSQSLGDRVRLQADRQHSAAEEEERLAAERTAAQHAARHATAQQQQAVKAAAAQEAAEREIRRAAAEAARETRRAAEAAREKAEAERRAELARSYVTPLSTYTLSAGFGQAGDRWAANHTGLDFAAPAGTPVKAIHGGTITQAGWAGAYGYRAVLTLDDGTELWFCHLSSLVRISGRVTAGDIIGRVGATGNVTGPHLHLEVRPGGTPVDPKPWLRDHGLAV